MADHFTADRILLLSKLIGDEVCRINIFVGS